MSTCKHLQAESITAFERARWCPDCGAIFRRVDDRGYGWDLPRSTQTRGAQPVDRPTKTPPPKHEPSNSVPAEAPRVSTVPPALAENLEVRTKAEKHFQDARRILEKIR